MKIHALKSKRITLITFSILLILLGIFVTWFLFKNYLDTPRYTRLNISSPTAYLVNGGWYTEDFTIQSRESGSEKFAIWRVETYLMANEVGPQKHFPDEEAIVSYFKDWLKNNGWTEVNRAYDNACSFLPEDYLLEPDALIEYAGFTQGTTSGDGYEPTACILISRDKKFDRYMIVLSTIAPTYRTGLLRCLEVNCGP